MPLRVISGRTYVTLWNDVWLPNGAPTVAGPDPRYDFIVSVELRYVEALILKHQERKATFANIPAEVIQRYRDAELVKKPLQPEDVAKTVSFLMSEASRNYSGTVFDLNNGFHM